MGIKVLSLFDGMACGLVALKRLGIKVDKYYASEINPHAIHVAKINHPEIIHVGDITKINKSDIKSFGEIDLILAGSPCQGFSIAGKQLNFQDERSKLFFEFKRILDAVKPKYWLLENVKMKNEYKDAISDLLGVLPVMINSSLVSAQNIKRIYWSNIPDISQPDDKNIRLWDIIHENTDCIGRHALYEYIVYAKLASPNFTFTPKSKTGMVGYFRGNSQANRVWNITRNKSVTLLGEAGGGSAKMGMYLFQPIYSPSYIRKLTPVECERLQTLPDHYTAYAPNNQRYKMLGNGWTIDVICHILKHINF